MKRITRVIICAVLIMGLVYTPVTIPQLSNNFAVATAEAATVKINKKKVTVYAGTTVQLKMIGTKKKVTWTTNKKAVATVKGGKVTAIKVGTATITAKVAGKEYQCKVVVKAAPKLNFRSKNIYVGEKTTLKLNGYKIGKVKWTTSNETIATVNNGVVTGKKAGTATIEAVVGGKTCKCVVTVKKSMTVNKQKLHFTDVNQTQRIILTFKWGESFGDIIPDSNIATVKWDENWKGNTIGVTVTAKGGGETSLTVYNSSNNEKIVIPITVEGKSVQSKLVKGNLIVPHKRDYNNRVDIFVQNLSDAPIEISGIAWVNGKMCKLNCDMNQTFILEPGYEVTLPYYRASWMAYAFDSKYYDMYLDETSEANVNFFQVDGDGFTTIWMDADDEMEEREYDW